MTQTRGEDETDLASSIQSLSILAVGVSEKDDVVDKTIKHYIKYNDKVYAVEISQKNGEKRFTKTVEYKYTKTGREGEKYKYDIDGDGTEEECTILYDYGEGKGIEIVAPDTVGENILLDSSIKWEEDNVKNEADIDKNNELSKAEKNIYKYSEAVKTINDYAKEQVKNTSIKKENIRSVGSNPSNIYSENTTLYTSKKLEHWASGKYNGILKGTDENYEEDLIRMSYYGIASVSKRYWFPSRLVQVSSEEIIFSVRCIDPVKGARRDENLRCLSWWFYHLELARWVRRAPDHFRP